MSFTRRSLIGRGALLVASGLLAPSFITRTALALDGKTSALGPVALDASKSKNILVVLQLSGGNDGINTLIPFADPNYAKLRPSLGIAATDVLKLTDSVGLNPSLGKLKALYDQGKMAVVQGVGYPNPNRSHFRSMDIWHSAAPDTFERSGWLGRYVAACQCAQDNALPAVSVGDQLNTMFWTETTLVPAVASIGAYSFLTDTKYKNDRTYQMQTLQNIYSQAGNWSPYEGLIRRGTLNALSSSDDLQKVAAAYKSPVAYPNNNGLANQLKLVAQVIAGNLGTRLFSVSMGGFDTHANQKDNQNKLLGQLGDAVDAFMQDLASLKVQDNVTIMTFSEFGRRAKQNGSNGTDHGTAEPMFIIGNQVKGGLYGSYPSLSDLDNNGDIKFGADFRSVYAGLLKDIVGADPTPILAGGYSPMAVVRG
ncbi:MAG TPA: DUF1501 domain-containing protein [Chloroflexota bacterium]|jgi:uncharacterized protein (DUF1501 family)|nr:DUF1501 domain-containing protein [Chloroflexota bacterium]